MLEFILFTLHQEMLLSLQKTPMSKRPKNQKAERSCEPRKGNGGHENPTNSWDFFFCSSQHVNFTEPQMPQNPRKILHDVLESLENPKEFLKDP